MTSSSPLKISNKPARLPIMANRDKLLSLHNRLELKKQHVNEDISSTRPDINEKENSSPILKKYGKQELGLSKGSNNVSDGSPEPKKKLILTPYSRRIDKHSEFEYKNLVQNDTQNTPKIQIMSNENHKAEKRMASVQEVEETSHKLARRSTNESNVTVNELEKLRAQHSVEIISWKARLAGKDSEIEMLKKSLISAEERIQCNQRELSTTIQNINDELHKKYQSKHHSRVQGLKKELEETHLMEKQNLELDIKSLKQDKNIMDKEMEIIHKEKQEIQEKLIDLKQENLKEIKQLKSHYEILLAEKDKQLNEFLIVFEEYKSMADKNTNYPDNIKLQS